MEMHYDILASHPRPHPYFGNEPPTTAPSPYPRSLEIYGGGTPMEMTGSGTGWVSDYYPSPLLEHESYFEPMTIYQEPPKEHQEPPKEKTQSSELTPFARMPHAAEEPAGLKGGFFGGVGFGKKKETKKNDKEADDAGPDSSIRTPFLSLPPRPSAVSG